MLEEAATGRQRPALWSLSILELLRYVVEILSTAARLVQVRLGKDVNAWSKYEELRTRLSQEDRSSSNLQRLLMNILWNNIVLC